MKLNPAVFWRIVTALLALIVSLSFFWFSFRRPDYAAALLFTSGVIQLVIYIAYKKRFP